MKLPKYQKKCTCCNIAGGPNFARLYYKKIGKSWEWFCKNCLDVFELEIKNGTKD